ncbi:MAG: M56 family metallopeptidase [Idiomarina sp.]|nr:M56 family metallopeptidase [Idiomarina sp.]
MISTLITITVVTSCTGLTLLVGHAWLLRAFGPRTTYSLWLLLPVTAAIIALNPLLLQLYAALPFASSVDMPVVGAIMSVQSSVEGITNIQQQGGFVKEILIGIWVLGAIALMVLPLIQLRRLKRLPIAHKRLLRVSELAAGESAGMSGIRKPHLLLPADFRERYSAEQRRLIINHELQHWRRQDVRVNFFAWFILASQWFNPVIWLSYQRFRADQELVCDADVMDRHHRNTSTQICYANALLAAMQFAPPEAARNLHGLLPSSTQYEHQSGAFIMAKERINTLAQNRSTRLLPLAASIITIMLVSILWNSPSYSQGTGAALQPNQPMQPLEPAALANPVEPITPIVRIEPRYPAYQAERGIEGYVDLEFVIDNSGKVTDIEILRSSPQGDFDEEAVRALERWRYVPQDNVMQRIRLEFSLNQE